MNLVTDYSACNAQINGSPLNGLMTSASGGTCSFDRTRFPFDENTDIYFRLSGETADEIKLSPIYRITPNNVAPVISLPSSQMTVVKNRPVVNVNAYLSDADSQLTCTSALTVRSDNPALLLNSKVIVGGVAPNCTLSLSPEKDAVGSALVSLIVSDGSLSASASFQLIVVSPDVTPPLLTVQSPLSKAIVKNNITLSGTCEAGLQVVVQSSSVFNSPQVTQCGLSGTYSLPLTLVGTDGPIILSLSSQDGSGNLATVPLELIRDLTPPLITIGAPSQSAVNALNQVSYSITFSDVNGVASVGLTVDGVSLVSTGTANCNKTLSGTGLTRTLVLSGCSGLGTIGFKLSKDAAADAAGNLSAVTNVSGLVNVDAIRPVIQIGIPTLSQVNKLSTVSYMINFSDTGGVDSVNMPADSVSLVTTGNASCATTVSGSGNISRTVELSNCTGNGSVALNVKAGVVLDNYGNESAAVGSNTAVTVVNPAPALSITSHSQNDVVSASVALAGTCEAGLDVVVQSDFMHNSPQSTQCGLMGTFSIPITLTGDEGAVIVNLSSQNALENESRFSLNLILDLTPPLVTVGPSNRQLVNAANSVIYSLAFSDTNGIASVGLSESQISLVKTSTANCNKALSGSGSVRTLILSGCTGAGTIAVSISAGAALDTAGNASVATPAGPAIDVDAIVPIIQIESPSVSSVNQAGTVSYMLNFSDNIGVDSVAFPDSVVSLISSGNAVCDKRISGTSPLSRLVQLSNCTGNGTIALTVKAGVVTDVSGNSSTAAGPSATVTVDNSIPFFSVSYPQQGIYVSNNVTVSGTCEVGANVVAHSSSIQSSPQITQCDMTGTFSFALTILGAEGLVSLNLSSQDSSGNTSSTVLNLLRDVTPPLVSIGSPDRTAVNASDSVSYSLSITDANGVTSVGLFDSAITLVTTGTANCNKALTGSGLIRTLILSNCTGAGTIGFNVAAGIASDAADNSSVTTALSDVVSIDASLPTVQIGVSSTRAVKQSGVVSFTLQFDDNLGIDSIDLPLASVTASTTGDVSCTRTLSQITATSQVVQLSNCTGNGTIALNVVGGVVTDVSGNASLPAGPSAVVTVDNASPTLSVSYPAPSVVVSDSVTFIGTCEGGQDVIIESASMSISPQTTQCGLPGTFSLPLTLIGDEGTMTFALSSQDAAGNETTLTLNLIRDVTPPQVSVGSPSQSTVNATNSVSYLLSFTDSNGIASVGLTPAGISLVRTGTADCSKSLTGNASTRVLTLSGCTGAGTVGFVLLSGAATDAGGNPSAVTALSNLVSVDAIAPAVQIDLPSVSAVNQAGSVLYTVNFTDNISINSIDFTDTAVSITSTGSALCERNVSGSGTQTRIVELSNCSGNGTVAVRVNAGVVLDTYGNSSAASTLSTAFTVENPTELLAVLSPMQNAVVADAVTLVGLCEAGAEVVATSLSIQNSPQMTTCTNLSTFLLPLTLTGAGGTLKIILTQEHEGEISNFDLNVIRDVAPPYVSVGTPSSSVVRSGSGTTLTLTPTDNSGIASVSVTSTEITLEASTGVSCKKSISGVDHLRFLNLHDCTGNGLITAVSFPAGIATDLAGNTSAAFTKKLAIVVDNVVPVLTIDTPADGSSLSGTPITIPLEGTCEAGRLSEIKPIPHRTLPKNSPLSAFTTPLFY